MTVVIATNDRPSPAQVMAASTVDIPAIVLSGGPMLDGCRSGRRREGRFAARASAARRPRRRSSAPARPPGRRLGRRRPAPPPRLERNPTASSAHPPSAAAGPV